jgi:Ca-activated chloride channel family protein
MKVDAKLTFEKIRHDQDTDAHLVVTLTAPPLEETVKRPRICIVPVIDVSPSMQGEKLAYAKRSVEKLIDHLGPNDYCGLVQFSSTAEVLQRPTKTTTETKAELKRKVANLRIGNATNIADAILVGLELGNQMDLPGEVVTRVIIFTDGQANRGPATTTPELVKLLNANIGSCTLSAFGYGADADQNLLAELAKKGNANYAFVQNPDDALTAFGKELGGLISTYATNLVFNINPCAEHEIEDVISDVDSEEEKVGGGVKIKIPDILCEEVRNIVLAVKLKGQKGTGPRAVNVFEIKGGYDILDATSKKERKGFEAKGKVQFVKEGDESKAPEDDLAKIVGLAAVVRAQLEAEEKAKRGDYQGAVLHMQAASHRLGTQGLGQAQAIANRVAARLGDAGTYCSSTGYLRSMAGGGTRGYGVASYDAAASAELSSMGVQLSNSSQTATSNSFAAGSSIAVSGDQGGAAPAPAVNGLLADQFARVQADQWSMYVDPNRAVGGPSWVSNSVFVPPAAPPAPPQTDSKDKDEKRESARKRASKKSLSKKSRSGW